MITERTGVLKLFDSQKKALIDRAERACGGLDDDKIDHCPEGCEDGRVTVDKVTYDFATPTVTGPDSKGYYDVSTTIKGIRCQVTRQCNEPACNRPKCENTTAQTTVHAAATAVIDSARDPTKEDIAKACNEAREAALTDA